jgi:hypothetical protein
VTLTVNLRGSSPWWTKGSRGANWKEGREGNVKGGTRANLKGRTRDDREVMTRVIGIVPAAT